MPLLEVAVEQGGGGGGGGGATMSLGSGRGMGMRMIMFRCDEDAAREGLTGGVSSLELSEPE